MVNIQTNSGGYTINGAPSKCPFCHQGITPHPIYGHQEFNNLDVLFLCPNLGCKRTFIAYYTRYGTASFKFNNQVTQGTLSTKSFEPSIISISPAFVTIYNQAFSAEQQNLTEICGVGFRKALEFLIKDYIISENLNNKDLVEKKMLGACIGEFVNDARIKKVAKRAVWLGNDETHYVKKWEGKNLQDLKILIDLTVHWIEMEVLTKTFENDMPD